MDGLGPEVAGERRCTQGDSTRMSLQRQPMTPFSGRYTELMHKYPRAFKLQLEAEQDRMLVDRRDHETLKAQLQALETLRIHRAEVAAGDSQSPDVGYYKDDLSHIISMLAKSLASRTESLPKPEAAAFANAPLYFGTRPKPHDAITELQQKPAAVGEHCETGLSAAAGSSACGTSTHINGDISGSRGGNDLRSRLQRNKEVMQKLLGDGLPFKLTSPDATAPSHNFADDWHESLDGATSKGKPLPRTGLRLFEDGTSTSYKSLPRTRLGSYEPVVRTASINRDDRDAFKLASAESRSQVLRRDSAKAAPLLTGSYYTGQQLTFSARDSDVPQGHQYRRERYQPSAPDTVCHQVELGTTYRTKDSLSCGTVDNAGASVDDSNRINCAASTSANHPAPKLKKKSNSAKAFRATANPHSDAGLEAGSQSSRPSVKSHSILRSSESFGGSTSKAGRVRFLETPDTIDETEPRLAELKLLSETSVFENDSCECDEDGAAKRQSSTDRKRRSRRPPVMRSLASPQAPPKPARLYLSPETDDGTDAANGALGDQNKRLPEDGMANTDAWHEIDVHSETSSQPSSTEGYLTDRFVDRDSSSRLSEPTSDSRRTTHVSANRSSSAKAKSSRRAKLAASDFEQPYPTSMSDLSEQLVKPTIGSEKVLTTSAISTTLRDENGIVVKPTEPTDDFRRANAVAESGVLVGSETLCFLSAPGKSSQPRSAASSCGKIVMDLPGTITDGIGEVARSDERCDRQLISDGLGEAAGIATGDGETTSKKDVTIPIYDLDEQCEFITSEAVESEADTSLNTSNRLSRSDLRPIHGRLSGSQQSLSERMGSLRRAARGAIKTIRRAMSLERLSPSTRGSMRTDAGGDSSSDAAQTPLPSSVPVLMNAHAAPLVMPPSPSPATKSIPSVKKSLSLRSFGKLTFKKRASYDVSAAGENVQPATTKTVNSPLRVSTRSGMANLRSQQAQPASTVQPETSVDCPKNFRAIGKLLELHDDGTITIQLQRPPHGPFGFYVGRAGKQAATTAAPSPPAADAHLDSAVCITRLSDSYPEKLFSGLLGVGDELLEVNRRPVSELSLNDIYDVIAATSDFLLLRVRPLRAQAARPSDSTAASS